MFELAKNAISKNPIVYKILLKKILELSLYHRFLDFKAIIMLMVLLNYRFIEKKGGKKDLIEFVGPSGFEVNFTLLTKLIAI